MFSCSTLDIVLIAIYVSRQAATPTLLVQTDLVNYIAKHFPTRQSNIRELLNGGMAKWRICLGTNK